jgi:hypothetical protein
VNLTDSNFKVKNTLVVNNVIQANSGGIYFSNTLTLNSSTFVGTSNNSLYLGGVSSGSYVNTSGQYTFTNTITYSANIIFSSTISLSANGSAGSANQVLTSNGTSPFWKTLANSALVDTTNASNISLGTLSQSRLANVLFSNTTNQTITGGATVNSSPLSIGNFTANPGLSPLQYITNNGAFTITAPSNDGTMLVLITNGSAANTITFSGFTTGSSTGDTIDYTNGHMFILSIMRIHNYSTYIIKSLQ